MLPEALTKRRGSLRPRFRLYLKLQALDLSNADTKKTEKQTAYVLGKRKKAEQIALESLSENHTASPGWHLWTPQFKKSRKIAVAVEAESGEECKPKEWQRHSVRRPVDRLATLVEEDEDVEEEDRANKKVLKKGHNDTQMPAKLVSVRSHTGKIRKERAEAWQDDRKPHAKRAKRAEWDESRGLPAAAAGKENLPHSVQPARKRTIKSETEGGKDRTSFSDAMNLGSPVFTRGAAFARRGSVGSGESLDRLAGGGSEGRERGIREMMEIVERGETEGSGRRSLRVSKEGGVMSRLEERRTELGLPISPGKVTKKDGGLTSEERDKRIREMVELVRRVEGAAARFEGQERRKESSVTSGEIQSTLDPRLTKETINVRFRRLSVYRFLMV
ncbi:hypothetical protein HDU96_006622 [Phlyctochytrium bullatum]|nr:hypothetical protein HDU96_006622 [Phlyctochytrium bullatum]